MHHGHGGRALDRLVRLVSATEYAAIAADHPNLVATKNSTDSMQRVRSVSRFPTDALSELGAVTPQRGFVDFNAQAWAVRHAHKTVV